MAKIPSTTHDSVATARISPRLRRRKQLEQDLAHVTEEMYRRNRELAETNKTLSLLRQIDNIVLESHDSVAVTCGRITAGITAATDYAFAGLFVRSMRDEEILQLAGWSVNYGGHSQELGFAHPPHLSLEGSWFASSEQSKIVDVQAITVEELARLLHSSPAEINHVQRRLPLESVYVVKLKARHHLVGMLVVGFIKPVAQLNEFDALLLDRLSEGIGVALDNKLLFEENQRVLKQLKQSNAKLRALDEAKDDFISMASHQLRTPLTSVKGYLSMVLEGDTGTVTPMQRKMLGQAFFSSQRMVYLIADLLNVSRLRTGKFIIDPKPVDLATVVDEELSQLQETAAVHNLKLTYNKPKEFPTLMLDETKTRQVIMNFVDNAIYYTPAGGKIAVKLIETPTTVEFRVTDNGIGVPKAEQHHLFTKFYRAGNARKARPDGTGLGLFMAKKVVMGQGGAIIFESSEGKGSTFGFVFSKSKLAVSAKHLPDTGKALAGAAQ